MLQTRKVQSSIYPEPFEVLQGKKLININVVETVSEATEYQESVTSYEYTQILADVDANLEETIEQHYKDVAGIVDESIIEEGLNNE